MTLLFALLAIVAGLEAIWLRIDYARAMSFQVGWQRPKSVEEADRLAAEIWEAAKVGEEKTQ